MCRSTFDGGRRCPSHTDPVLISNRNARRRAKYAQSHSEAKEQAESSGVRVSHSVAPTFLEHSLFGYEDPTGNDDYLYYKSKSAEEATNAFGVSAQEYKGYLVSKGYIDSKQYSGLVNYTKMDENSYKEFGFQEPSEIRKASLKSRDVIELSKAELKEMPVAYKKALNTFTSENYQWINGALYGNPTLVTETDEEALRYEPRYNVDEVKNFDMDEVIFTEERTPSFVKEVTSALDKALNEGPKQQRILYRGMNEYHNAWGLNGPEKYVDENYAVGKEFKFDGYQSATYSPSGALNRVGHNGLMFEIRSPSGVNVSSVSDYPDEEEAILPRDARYMVVGIHKKVSYTAGVPHSSWENKRSNVTVVQLVEITESGYVKDETNFTSPSPITENQLKTTKY
jgi:hypothetical protein